MQKNIAQIRVHKRRLIRVQKFLGEIVRPQTLYLVD